MNNIFSKSDFGSYIKFTQFAGGCTLARIVQVKPDVSVTLAFALPDAFGRDGCTVFARDWHRLRRPAAEPVLPL